MADETAVPKDPTIDEIISQVLKEPGIDPAAEIAPEIGGGTAENSDSGPATDAGGAGEGVSADDAGGPAPAVKEPAATDQSEDPRIAHYRTIADQRLLQLDQQNYQLRQEVQRLQKVQEGSTDWRERAKSDPRGVAEDLGIGLDRLLAAYSGQEDQQEPAAVAQLPKEIADKLSLLDQIPRLQEALQRQEQDRRAAVLRSLQEEALGAVKVAEDQPLTKHLPGPAAELALHIRASYNKLYGKIPGYSEIMPLVEEGLTQKYPELANALSKVPQQQAPAAPAAPAHKPNGGGIESLQSGSAPPTELSAEQELARIIQDVTSNG